MDSKNTFSFSLGSFGAFLLVLALSIPRVASAQSAGDYVIGAQDVLSIAVFDQADLGGKYAVELDGSFTFPLVGRVKAGGLTIRNFESELKKRLADGFFRDPQVTVAIEQYRSQRVFVTGEVRSPGSYALTGDMTLIEVLAKAGSTTPNASEEAVVVRGTKDADGPTAVDAAGEREILRVNLKDLQSGAASVRNIGLRDGDTIYVARAELVYVFGEVKSPSSYPIKTDTTVLQALSLAGGVTPNGAMNRTKIIRIIDGVKKEISVKLTEIVQPGDTIMVPERYF
jgi:polysaccharide export outer membrane protein